MYYLNYIQFFKFVFLTSYCFSSEDDSFFNYWRSNNRMESIPMLLEKNTTEELEIIILRSSYTFISCQKQQLVVHSNWFIKCY